MIDYDDFGEDPHEPLWLRAQREQALEAGVGLDASDPGPACNEDVDGVGVAHEFRPSAEVCVCGRFRIVTLVGAMTLVQRPGWQAPPSLTDIEPSGLDDEDVRRLEHPEEFQ